MTTHYDLEDRQLPNENINHNRRFSQANRQTSYGGKGFYYHNKLSDPCPVCGSHKKHCATRKKTGRDGSVYVHCRGEKPSPDAEYTGKDDSIGFKIYRLKGSLPQPPRDRERYDWEVDRHETASPISDKERVAEFKKLFKQLGLSTPHRKSLEKRGLTPELIEKYQFKSIDSDTELIIPVSPGMPLRYGKKFNIKGKATLIPVWQGDEIVGAQMRLDEANSGGKYRWLKSKNSSHLANGEMPLAAIVPDEIVDVGVGICESVGLKPTIAAERLGKIMTGASGANFTGSPKQLLALLEKYHPDKAIPVVLYPDAGALGNKQVLGQYDKCRRFLEGQGYTLKVAWWGQWEKETSLDIDDYLVGGGNDIKIIDWEQYDHYHTKLKALYKKSRRYKPDVRVNERYLPSDIISKYVKRQTIITVKSVMGTGKTTAYLEAIKRLCNDRGALLLGARNSLLLQVCAISGFHHLRNDDAAIHMLDERSMIANCVDSLPRWADEHLEGRIIIADEISALILHLLAGATCKKQFDLILRKFVHLLRHAYAIILLDANLKDWEVDFIAKLSGFNDIIKIQNDYKPEPWDVSIVCGDKTEDDITRIIKNPTATNGSFLDLISPIINNPNPIVVVSDGIDSLQAIHEMLGFANPRVLRIDSSTVDTPEVRAFLANPDSYITQNNIRYLLYSPTVNAGLDIKTRHHFTDMYAFNFHLGTDEFMQMLGRVRDVKCKRHIYAREYVNTSTNNFNSPVKSRVKDAYINQATEDLRLALQNDPKLRHLIPQLEAIINSSNDASFDAFAQLQAQINYERKNLRETLRDRLEEEGHNVTDVYLERDPAIKLKYKEAKEQVISSNTSKMFNSPDIGLVEADKILSSWSAKYDDVLAAKKSVFINSTLPGIKYTDLYSLELIRKVAFDDPQLINRLTMRWHILNPDKSEIIQQQLWLRQIEKSKIYIPDWRSPRLTAYKFLDIGILTILNNPDREWTGDDKELIKFCQLANHPTRRDYFPRKKSKSNQGRKSMENIQYANLILGRLGYKLYLADRRDGKRFYKLTDIYETLEVGGKACALSSQIMEILSQKLGSRAERAETYIQEQIESVSSTPIFNKYSGEVVIDESPPPRVLQPDKPLPLEKGYLVDVTADRDYGMCEILEASAENVRVKWGFGLDQQIFNFSTNLITRIWKEFEDGIRPIWTC